MDSAPEDLKYTDEHEWVRVEDDGTCTIGITDYAQESLGEIVFVELPSEGDQVSQGDSFGGVESTKSVSDLFAPVSGEVTEANEELLESPDLINTDPYEEGWIVRINPDDSAELDSLMDAADYTEFVESLE